MSLFKFVKACEGGQFKEGNDCARGGGFASGNEKIAGDSAIQKDFDEVAATVRSSGSETYTSMSASPNLKGGMRHFIDVKNKDKSKEREHVNKIQKEMDKKSAFIRSEIKGSETYVSSETSPIMGTRVFMDVKLN